MVISGNQVVGRYVDIFAERGEDRGKRIEIGKDLVAVNKSISTEELVQRSGLEGKGKSWKKKRERKKKTEIRHMVGGSTLKMLSGRKS